MIKILITYLLSFSVFCLTFGQVDYNSEIQTIFTNNCGNCHLGSSSGGLNLLSYTNVMNGGSGGAVITPYDHTTSELYNRITLPESSDSDMPPSGSLVQSEIDLIAQWIDEGALEDPGSSSGCTDPEAYNCADDNWSCVDGGGTPADCMDSEEWPNYTFLVGTTPYINGCNYDNTDPYDGNFPIYEGGCESGPCEGFYNPGATTDDGSCDYYQAPDQDDITFTVSGTGILVDWSAFSPPSNAIISGYNIARCTGGCAFITGSPFQGGWGNGGNTYTETSINDEFDWASELAACGDPCGGQVKYSINVRYSNAEEYGMAIETSYITPESCPCAVGDCNCDGSWNVLDIVALANCVLADSCGDIPYGCAGDTNGDGGWNVLDIVSLANCVLAGTCGG